MGESGGSWADSGQDADGCGDPGLVGPGIGNGGKASNNGELSELHID